MADSRSLKLQYENGDKKSTKVYSHISKDATVENLQDFGAAMASMQAKQLVGMVLTESTNVPTKTV